MHTVHYRLPWQGLLQMLIRIVAPRQFQARCELPSKWSEMSDDQIMGIVPLLYNGDSPEVQKLKVLRQLIEIPGRVWQALSPAQVWEMLEEIKWIWTSPPEMAGLATFTFKEKKYLLPAQGLTNMVAIEFANAEQYLKQFMAKEPNAQALDLLVATICRPEKANLNVNDPEFDGDRREKYNSDICSRRAVEFRQMSIGLRMAILQWYIAQVSQLQKDYAVIWPAPDDEDDDEPRATTRTQSPLDAMGMTKVIMDIADGNTFGDFEKTCFTSLHTILTYLAQRKITHQEAERERKLQKALS